MCGDRAVSEGHFIARCCSCCRSSNHSTCRQQQQRAVVVVLLLLLSPHGGGGRRPAGGPGGRGRHGRGAKQRHNARRIASVGHCRCSTFPLLSFRYPHTASVIALLAAPAPPRPLLEPPRSFVWFGRLRSIACCRATSCVRQAVKYVQRRIVSRGARKQEHSTGG